MTMTMVYLIRVMLSLWIRQSRLIQMAIVSETNEMTTMMAMGSPMPMINRRSEMGLLTGTETGSSTMKMPMRTGMVFPDAFADFISGGKSSTTIVFRRSSYEASNISFATGWG